MRFIALRYVLSVSVPIKLKRTKKKNTNIQKLYRIRNFDLTWIYFEIAAQNNSYLAFIHVIFLIMVTMSYRYNR